MDMGMGMGMDMDMDMDMGMGMGMEHTRWAHCPDARKPARLVQAPKRAPRARVGLGVGASRKPSP